MNEQESLASNRDYFESGCRCIKDGVVQKLAKSVEDSSAVAYYERACRCSRNYIPISRDA